MKTMTKKSTPTAPATIEKDDNTVIDKVLKLFQTHLDTTGAILDDYVVGNDGMFTELTAADGNFISSVRELIDEDAEFDKTRFLADLENEVGGDHLDSDEVMEHVDEEDVCDFLAAKGYVIVKIENMNHQMMLEDFIKAHIYPHHSDQETYLFS